MGYRQNTSPCKIPHRKRIVMFSFAATARRMMKRKIGRGDTEVTQCLQGEPAFDPSWRRIRWRRSYGGARSTALPGMVMGNTSGAMLRPLCTAVRCAACTYASSYVECSCACSSLAGCGWIFGSHIQRRKASRSSTTGRVSTATCRGTWLISPSW